MDIGYARHRKPLTLMSYPQYLALLICQALLVNYSALLSKEKLLRQLLRQHRGTWRNKKVLYRA
jgi:hypothetical protein